MLLFGDEPCVIGEQPGVSKLGAQNKARGAGGDVGGLHGDHVAARSQMLCDVELDRGRPVLALDDAPAVNEQGELVVAGGDGRGGFEGFLQGDGFAEVNSLQRGRGGGVALIPNPNRRGRFTRGRRGGLRCVLGEHAVHRADLAALFAAVQTLEGPAVLPLAAEGGEGVDELLGLQALGYGAAEDKGAFAGFARRQLIGAAGANETQGVLEVVFVCGQIVGEPVEQIGIPRGLIEIIKWLHQAAPQQSRPKAVDDHAAQAAIRFGGHQCGQLLQSLSSGRLGVDAAQFREDETHLRRFAGRLVAPVQFEAVIGKDRGERVGVLQLPVIYKTVVTRGALQIGAHEHLRNILCRLHLAALAGVHGATPLDALHKPSRIALAADQFADELVIRHVCVQGAVEPGGDLRAAVVDEARAEVGVAEVIVPKAHPMIGVSAIVLQQAIDKRDAFVGRRVGYKRFQFIHRRQQSYEIQPHAPGIGAVIHQFFGGHLKFLEIISQQPVDGIAFAGGQRHRPGLQWRTPPVGEVVSFGPCNAFVDPSFDQGNFLGR